MQPTTETPRQRKTKRSNGANGKSARVTERSSSTESERNTPSELGEPNAKERNRPTLKAIASKLKKRARYQPPTDEEERKAELRRLVVKHRGLTSRAQTLLNLSIDKVCKATGEIMPCPVEGDTRLDMDALKEKLKRDANKLERQMDACMRGLPLYELFLKQVFGCGPVVAAYLFVLMLWGACPQERRHKSSAWVRWAGNANSRKGDIATLEKPGQDAASASRAERKLRYHPMLRTRLYQMMTAMWKLAAKESKRWDKPLSTKYLEIWAGYKQRMAHSPRVIDGTNYIDMDWKEARGAAALASGTGTIVKRETALGGTRVLVVDGNGKTISELRAAKKFIHSTGRRKATDVFLFDLYCISRALDGLPIWAPWNESKTGFAHGGEPAQLGPETRSAEEALALIGDVGLRPAVVLLADEEEED
jgi:hypothetical protein